MIQCKPRQVYTSQMNRGGGPGVELILGVEGFDKAGNQVSEVEMRV